MKGGRKVHDQIDEAIRLHDRLLLILSSESMSSGWVKTEIKKALDKEVHSKRNVLYPLALAPFDEIRAWQLFDADRGVDIASAVREYLILDFSTWETDHGKYLASFEKLVASLESAHTVPKREGDAGAISRMA